MVEGLRTIRDPLYGHIPYSRLEQSIIDRPLFQRLRNVSQNGLAHLTFPSNRTPRFTHSLGTMHAGSLYFRSALANSPALRPRFMAGAADLVTAAVQPQHIKPEAVARHMADRRDPFFEHMGIDFGDRRSSVARNLNPESLPDSFVIAAVLQGLRLACVVHDIGHLPFSHATEIALESILAAPAKPGAKRREAFKEALETPMRRYPGIRLHEASGLSLLDSFLRLSGEDDGAEHGFRATCIALAIEIARGTCDAGHPRSEIVRCLHEIVSGEVDADRSDYVRRDGYASGFEFAAFDFERLASSMVLTHVASSDCEAATGSELRIRPGTRALSSVESFFIARYRIYRWLVQNKNVARADLCLQRSLKILFDVYFDDPDPNDRLRRTIRRVLEEDAEFDRFWRAWKQADPADDYADTDEVWLMSLFHRVLKELDAGVDETDLDNGMSDLHTYLRVLVRRERGLVAIWRDLTGYSRFANAFVERALALRESQPYALFWALPEPARIMALLDGDPLGDRWRKQRFVNAVLAHQLLLVGSAGAPGGPASITEQFETKLGQALTRDGSVARVIFRPAQHFVPGPSDAFALVDDTDAVIPIASLSRLSIALHEAWATEVQAHAFAVLPSTIDRPGEGALADLAERIGELAAEILLDPRWRPLALIVPSPLINLEDVPRLGRDPALQQLRALRYVADESPTSGELIDLMIRSYPGDGPGPGGLTDGKALESFLAGMAREGVLHHVESRWVLTELGALVFARSADALRRLDA